MDTAITFPETFIEDFNSLRLADLTDGERILLIDYVALTRDMAEANQLFEVFFFNLTNMRNSFVFGINDTVIRTNHCPDFKSDVIAINSLVINLISSAKTLTEFLRCTANRWIGGNPKNDKKKYKDKYNVYVSDIYDTHFNYRFLINLRNYMQHGYLPVSFREGKYSFDVKQILDTPHFEVKGYLKNDIENFLEKLSFQYGHIPCVSLVITISDFVVNVTDIYNNFIFFFKDYVSDYNNKVKKLIEEKPSIVCDYHNTFKGYIIYDKDKNGYHAFNSKDDADKMMDLYKKRAFDVYKDEKQAYDELHSYLIPYKDIKL